MTTVNQEVAPVVGLRAEGLSGRTQQVFFRAEEEENLFYPTSYDVDFGNSSEFDAQNLSTTAINSKIRALMRQGCGTITVKNPGAKHSLGVGILNRLNLNFKGSLGYFGCGVLDGPNVRVSGRVGWSFGENMLSGTAVVEKNAGSLFGAAIRGGDLVCRGDVGARTGIDMKGGTLMIGGRAGMMSGFMMQRGRIVVLGDAGSGLGDSMYDGTIFVGGTIASLGMDAVESELTDLDVAWLTRKLSMYALDVSNVENMTKIVAGKKLWNYDNLEPSERTMML